MRCQEFWALSKITNQPGALPITPEDAIPMTNAVEGQEVGVVEKLPEQTSRHVLHHPPIS